MSAGYVGTPRTDAGDATSISQYALDYSVYQPFASPSKNPAEDLRQQMKGMRGGELKTPRARNPLLSMRQGLGRTEFTPLLKSAQRSRIVSQSILEEKENADATLKTPAALKNGYVSQTPGLPVNSSMLYPEYTASSADAPGDGSPKLPIASSSAAATPVPKLPTRGQGGVLDQGNVLTLREQEAKLERIDKENFGLKLRIHYLDAHLKKHGSEHQQRTIAENVELQTDKMTLTRDLKVARKALAESEHSLDEYRRQLREYEAGMKKRHRTERENEELERLQNMAEESQKIADERELELEGLKKQLEDVEQKEGDHARSLKEDMEDLEAGMQDRERQLDEKEEQLERLREQLENAQRNTETAEHLQQDVDELEAELAEKDQALDAKEKEIAELQERVNTVCDREKSTKKLHGDVGQLERQLREKEQALDNTQEQLRSFGKQLQATEKSNIAELSQRDEDLRRQNFELAQKTGEIQALKDRLRTARSSWDAETQQVDARLHEKDCIIQEKDAQLHEKARIIEERNDELENLQKRLRAAEGSQGEVARKQSAELQRQAKEIQELSEELRFASSSSEAKLKEKDGLIRSRESEMQTLQSRLGSLQAGENADLHLRSEKICDLEDEIRKRDATMQDQSKEITSLRSRLGAMETPSKKDSLIQQQAEQVRSLQQQLTKLEQDRDVEIDELKQHLQVTEAESAQLREEVDCLEQDTTTHERERSFVGHLSEEIKEKQRTIEELEDQVNDMQQKLRKAVQDRQLDAKALEQQLDEARSHASDQAQNAVRRLKIELEAEFAEAKLALEDEIVVLESSLDEAQADRAALEEELQSARLAKDDGTLVRERNELRLKLKNADLERANLKASITGLEVELNQALQSKTSGSPIRERSELRTKLREAQSEIAKLQSRVDSLRQDLEDARQEKTIAEERHDLHDSLKEAKIQAEDLQLKIVDRDRKISASARKEGELRHQLEDARGELESLQADVGERDARLRSCATKERELRAQLKELKEARVQLEVLEMQLDDRKGSSSGHARREAELRTQLRDAKIELEALQVQAAERDEQRQLAVAREQELRERLKNTRASSGDTLHFQDEDLQEQLDDADAKLASLQTKLQASVKREEELKLKVKSLRSASDNDRTIVQKKWSNALEVKERTHASELKGLAKQIQYLRAKCSREEMFRGDLVFVKRWFLMQVEMYGACNKADLRMLEEMGITPDQSFRQKKHSLRTVGIMVVASVRMRKMQQAWAGNTKLHESLLKKLDAMRRRQGKPVVRSVLP